MPKQWFQNAKTVQSRLRQLHDANWSYAMNITLLSGTTDQSCIERFLRDQGHVVSVISNKVADLSDADIVVCFGYRHILNRKTIDTAKRSVLNIHVSFLPFNRGAHPNFWSWMEGTPPGVSIHEVDTGIDTGPIVAQVGAQWLDDSMSFRMSYSSLLEAGYKLFVQNWNCVMHRNYVASPQPSGGSFHRVSDLPPWMNDWDMIIKDAKRQFEKTALFRSRHPGFGSFSET